MVGYGVYCRVPFCGQSSCFAEGGETMKKTLVILFMWCIACSNAMALSVSVDRPVMDSLFAVFRAERSDSARLRKINNAFQQYIGKPWSIELLDSAQALSRKLKDPKAELDTYYNRYRYFDLRESTEEIQQCFEELRSLSYTYKQYNIYFKTWCEIVKEKAITGSTEVAAVEIEQMRREADSLNYLPGVIDAEMAMAANLGSANRDEEAVAFIHKILSSYDLTHSQKGELYQRLSNVYSKKNEYDKAVECMEIRKKELKYIAAEDPSRNMTGSLVSLEAGFCKIYLAMPNTAKLKEHLEEMEKLKNDSWSANSYVSYHTYWAGYYYLIKDLEKSYKSYDLAMEAGKDLNSVFMISVREMKGQCARFWKDYKVAAESYQEATRYGNAINQKIIRENEEARAASFNIRKTLLDYATNEKRIGMLKAGLSGLLLIAFLAMLWHIIHVHRILRRSVKAIAGAWAVADSANKMKETFLRNVTGEIKVPVDSLLNCAEVLASTDEIPQEQREQYAAFIKKNSQLLLGLVSNVLDLSRLEAGMMRFQVGECDLVVLCRDAEMAAGLQKTNCWQYAFRTDCEYLKAEVDTGWFNRLLLFSLSTPAGCREDFTVVYTLAVENECGRIEINTHPSVLSENTQSQHICHEINRLYLEHFGGSYQVTEQQIIIIYPLKRLCEN